MSDVSSPGENQATVVAELDMSSSHHGRANSASPAACKSDGQSKSTNRSVPTGQGISTLEKGKKREYACGDQQDISRHDLMALLKTHLRSCCSESGAPNHKSSTGCAACGPQAKQTIKPDLIFVDGVTNARDRDAPGQNCVYILSGDHEREDYRTATFGKFPDNVPVFSIGLAKAGFYYTGFKDRVKCFSCGMTVENWIVGDDVFLDRWHKNDCPMPRGGDPRNVPSISEYRVLCKPLYDRPQNIGGSQTQINTAPVAHQQDRQYSDVTSRFQNVNLANNTPPLELRLADIHDAGHEHLLRNLNLRSEEDRRKTYKKWPSYPAPRLARFLAKNGLFYLGNLDRTQCFCCGGVLRNWMATDVVAEQHQRHFPQCRMVTQDGATGNIPMSQQARIEADAIDDARLNQIMLSDADPVVEPPDLPPLEKQRLAALFPLNYTVNPHMASLQRRIESFAGWPARVRATIEHIARAGFFFLGESDKTKCFYCNGGLQNWDRNDEPWAEHAKWFPGCAFILRERGVEFVKRLVELHPNLNRPAIRHPVSYNVPQDIPPSEGRMDVRQASTFSIESVINMGFPAERVQRTMRRKMEREGRGYTNVEELLEDLLLDEPSDMETNTSSTHEAEEDHQVPGGPQIVQTSATVGQKRNGSSAARNSLEEVKKTRTQSPAANMEASSSHGMEEDLRVMQESDRCKNCRRNPADVMCIPCGHLALCSECSKKLTRCIICNAKVQSHMKVFRA